jgi:hypothetical protein
MKLSIHPYIGIGTLRFGMSVDAVRSTLGGSHEPFAKSAKSLMPTDAFSRLGMHIYYKKPGFCEAIELMEPSEPTFNGELLIGKQFSKIRALFEADDGSLKFDESGFTSLKFGVGIYCPAARDNPSALVESVIVFEKGYYN